MIQQCYKNETIFRGVARRILLLAFLAVGYGCASHRGGGKVFGEGMEPTVAFFQLGLADKVQRETEPRDAAEVYLKITNHGGEEIELYRAKLVLEGNIKAAVEAEREAVSQQIPPNDARIVRVRMRLISTESPLTSSGPLISTLRGQLAFHTPRGDATISIREKLDDQGLDEE